MNEQSPLSSETSKENLEPSSKDTPIDDNRSQSSEPILERVPDEEISSLRDYAYRTALDRDRRESIEKAREPLLGQLKAETEWVVKARSALSLASAGVGAKVVDTYFQADIFLDWGLFFAILTIAVGLWGCAYDLVLLDRSIKQIRSDLDFINDRVDLGALADTKFDESKGQRPDAVETFWSDPEILEKAKALRKRQNELSENQDSLVNKNIRIYIGLGLSIFFFLVASGRFAWYKNNVSSNKPQQSSPKPPTQEPTKIERSYGSPTPANTPLPDPTKKK